MQLKYYFPGPPPLFNSVKYCILLGGYRIVKGYTIEKLFPQKSPKNIDPELQISMKK